jgi:hypothetical protein
MESIVAESIHAISVSHSRHVDIYVADWRLVSVPPIKVA